MNKQGKNGIEWCDNTGLGMRYRARRFLSIEPRGAKREYPLLHESKRKGR